MWLVPREHLADWVKKRESILLAEEDAMFRACRDNATTVHDRAFWNAILAARERNRARTEGREPGPAT